MKFAAADQTASSDPPTPINLDWQYKAIKTATWKHHGMFASTIDAKSVVFVCDGAGSMMPRMPELKKHLAKAVRALRPDQQFDVIFMQDGRATAFSKEQMKVETLVPASDENKTHFAGFLREVTTQSTCDPMPALTVAFARKPSVIHLLTDGGFPDDDAVIKRIRELNRDKTAVVHTIAFVGSLDTDADFRVAFERIAKENNGTYRRVLARESAWDLPPTADSLPVRPVKRPEGEPLIPPVGDGKRVIYVCDRNITQEMRDETFLEMINEVDQAVHRLPESCSFNLIFACDTFPMSFSEVGPVRATREMKERCGDFLCQTDTDSDPGFDIAMRAALRQRPDVIYVVTDGAALVLDRVLNDQRKSQIKPHATRKLPQIHFIVLSGKTLVDEGDADVMNRLAELSGGSVRFVAPSWPASRTRFGFNLLWAQFPATVPNEIEWEPLKQ